MAAAVIMIFVAIVRKSGLTRFVFCPRICGEKQRRAMGRSSERGTPPRARGKESQVFALSVSKGNTPACAGKSPFFDNAVRATRDHPRACGEKIIEHIPGITLPGSPPRVRGKDSLILQSLKLTGITPARAGKRRQTCNFGCTAWDHPARAGKRTICGMRSTACRDHPRACGKKEHRPLRKHPSPGSPPRVRGKGVNSQIAQIL